MPLPPARRRGAKEPPPPAAAFPTLPCGRASLALFVGQAVAGGPAHDEPQPVPAQFSEPGCSGESGRTGPPVSATRRRTGKAGMWSAPVGNFNLPRLVHQRMAARAGGPCIPGRCRPGTQSSRRIVVAGLCLGRDQPVLCVRTGMLERG